MTIGGLPVSPHIYPSIQEAPDCILMPSGAHYEVNVVWTVGACLTGCPLDQGQEARCPAMAPPASSSCFNRRVCFSFEGSSIWQPCRTSRTRSTRSWFLVNPFILDLAQLTFLETSAIHCLIRNGARSGHPVVLRNASASVRRILDRADGQSHAWTFDLDESGSVPTG